MITDIIITPGTVTEVVSLAMVKKHLRIENAVTEEDDLIEMYIGAAIEHAENFIGGHILEKNMLFKMNQFTNPLVFEAFPVKEVTSVNYFNLDVEDAAVMPATQYTLTSTKSKVNRLTFNLATPISLQDRFDAVAVSITVGMLVVPKPIKQAILLFIADMYERREDRGEIVNTAAMSLLRNYKKY